MNKKDNCSLSAKKVCKWLGQEIQVNKGGPESRVGRLVVVGKDFLAIKSSDKGGKGRKGEKHDSNDLIYYQLEHVDGIIVKADELCSRKKKKCTDQTFREVLKKFKKHKVKINRGGHVEGILVAIREKTIELIKNDEIFIIPICRIKSLSQIGGCKKHKDESSHNKGKKSESSHRKESSHKNKSESSSSSSHKRKSESSSSSSSSSFHKSESSSSSH